MIVLFIPFCILHIIPKTGRKDSLSRKRVLKIVEEQNYIPYAKYRMKEGMANRLVGLVIPGNNSYYGVLIAMIEEALRERSSLSFPR